MKDMLTIAKQFDSVFDNFFTHPVYDEFFLDFKKSNSFNRIKFVEDSDSITYFTELPGVPKENIIIYLEDIENKKALVIEYDVEDKVFGKKEDRIVTFLKTKRGISYDTENIDATLENGMLKIKLNKISTINDRIQIKLK